MKDTTKKTLKRVMEILITILTALVTTLSAHATGLCDAANQLQTLPLTPPL